MSELKAFTFGLGQYTECGSPCVVAFDGEKNPRLASDEKFYLKSEADKVIAEKDAEIARLKDIRKVHVEAIESMGAGLLQDYDEIHHQKYKRCLAMVQVLEHVCPMTNRKAKWRDKWHKRWLAIAEKFKPNSTAQ